MKRALLIAVMVIAAASLALGQKVPNRPDRMTTNDEETLKQLVKEWADAVVHFSPNEASKLERFTDETFKGSADDFSFDKKTLVAALRSGQMKVARWDCNSEDMKVNVRGNSAVVTGRCTLSNAVYMGKDFSGRWDFTDRFVKQRDGSWRAVNSQARRIKE